MTTLDQFISNIYRSTAYTEPNGFRERALRLLHSLISFDAALWAIGSFELRKFHATTLLGLPASFAHDLIATSETNPITDKLYKHPGQAVDMAEAIADEQFYQSSIYQRCFQPYGIHRILSSAHLQERSGVFTILTLYRKNPAQIFTATEKKIQNQVLFHLLSAASHGYFLHLKQQQILNPGHYGAICDQHGFIHAAEPEFIDLLDKYVPQRTANKIPFAIQADRYCCFDQLGYQVSVIGDLFCIAIWPKGALDTLTQREREVVEGIGKGMTFKQIAKQLNLSPSTVSNHLYRIYNKLDIGSRSELANLLSQHGRVSV